MKKVLYFNIAILLMLLTAIGALGLTYPDTPDNTDAIVDKTALRVTVTTLDGTPLKKAKVTVLENGNTAFTNYAGKTGFIEVPFEQTHLTKTVSSNFSTVTLMVFCEGYADFILFNCLVYSDRMRDGPIIKMFESAPDLPYVALVEVPPGEWTQQLLEKYS